MTIKTQLYIEMSTSHVKGEKTLDRAHTETQCNKKYVNNTADSHFNNQEHFISEALKNSTKNYRQID